MQPYLSIIICSHNSRIDYLKRVLDALKAQTLTKKLWELLLIDNASHTPLSSEIDLNWHPHARHIREDQLGLTFARLRGIKESQAEILIFVDDDNVLNLNYLEAALTIGKDCLFVGAWGGQIFPEFKRQPPAWTEAYWWMLAIREFDRDKWSNLVHCYETIPCGAGLCVRRTVAQTYLNQVHHNPKRAALDRKGKLLTSCGDLDLAMTACDLGLGTGQFTALKLLHLMPPERFEESYLLRLAEANGYSSTILESLRGKSPDVFNPSWRGQLLNRYLLWRMDARERRFYQAFARGKALAIQELAAQP